MGFSDDISSSEIIFYIVVVLLLLWFVSWWLGQSPLASQCCRYGYSDCDGPHTWRDSFKIKGQNQSPIHILTASARDVLSEVYSDLMFSQEFHYYPAELRLCNDGTSVMICGKWCNCNCPTICGGPLKDQYKFYNMRFRWGINDDEGSEHMIDNRRYAMELQVFFTKNSSKSCIKNCAIVIITYFFEVTCTENPYLEPIIHSLQFIKNPGSSTFLMPFPISLLVPPFTNKYYTYCGSLTYPPCSEGVRWIIQPEPLTVSFLQTAKFREIYGCNGLMLSNTRPVQAINSRDIIYYE